jgi:hypothetical protein
MNFEKEWFSSVSLLGLPILPGTPQGINRLARSCNWLPKRRRKGRGGGWEYHISALPKKVRTALLLKASSASLESSLKPLENLRNCAENENVANWRQNENLRNCGQNAISESLWALWEAKPDKAKQEAKGRHDIVLAVMAMIDHGIKKGAAKRAAANEYGLSVSTVGRWLKLVKGYHRSDWAPVLLPKHAGRIEKAAISPEAWDYFKADYLRQSKPAASACYERLMRIAIKKGWEIPSLKTLSRKLTREVSKPVIIYKREGNEALSSSYPAQERDHSYYHALEAVNADGHKFDVFVRHPDGEINRPVLLAWQDIFSGKILSYRLDKTENTDSVRLSFGDMIEIYGIPEHAFLDNGRGFASKWMTGGATTRYRFKIKEDEPDGLFKMVGVNLHWCTPYHGQSKPIERSFRDLCEYIAKHPRFEGAYTGNKPDAKPENYGSKAVDLDVFLKILNQEIIHHNARQGRRSKVCAGRSFDEAFKASYETSEIRKASESQRRLWLLAAESVPVSKYDGSIRLDKNRYYCDALAEHMGGKVVARFDPDKLHENVFIYTLDGHYIGRAECIQAAGFGDRKAAREYNRMRNQRNKAVKKQATVEVRMTAIEAANMLPDVKPPETPVTKIVKPSFKKAVGQDFNFDAQEAFASGLKEQKRLRDTQSPF